MEQLEEGFVPDFEHVAEGGEICNRASVIKQAGEKTYISVNEKVNEWSTRFFSLDRVVSGLRRKITTFDYLEGIMAVGYDNGSIQVHSNKVNTFRPHSKRVVKMKIVEGSIISASTDGSIAHYDLVGEELRMFYEGNDVSVEGMSANERFVVVGSADCTLRVWDYGEKAIRSVHVFDKPIKYVHVKDADVIVFFKDGDCVLYMIEEKCSVDLGRFKKIRNTKIKGNVLYIQCKSNMYVYELSGTEKDEAGNRSIKLNHIKSITISDRYVDFDIVDNDRLVFACIDNRWECVEQARIDGFGYHRSDILSCEVYEGKLITFSKEKVILWKIDEESLEMTGSISIVNGKCMRLWNGEAVIGTDIGICVYSLRSHDIIKEEAIGRVSAVCTDGMRLFIGIENVLVMYGKNYKEEERMDVDEVICSMEASVEGGILCLGLLNSKVYIYSLNDMSLRLTLYGHSLPVRSMKVSPDGSELLTCGADRMVKMWGMQFGECRKSFVGDAKNAEYLNSSLFMFASGNVQYFNRYDKLKEYKRHDLNIIKVVGDTMICCGAFGVHLYKMSKYELQIDEESEGEEEIVRMANVVDYKGHERFMECVEQLRDSTGNEIEVFFEALMDIDFCELDKFLCLMSSLDVMQVMDALYKCIEWNGVLVARTFISLVRLHKEVCISHPKFEEMLGKITDGVRSIRKMVNTNEAWMLVSKSICDGCIADE
ncbi:beta transducin [Ordospora colligata]|uniref:WD40 domain-containing protein n=1 Tax=Ordospora colligata OC4 TaxID=1354746 RepID=A0A0B2UMN8_9MICR|nr:uncharacterized protein M896_021510 [Ordospora colligata OC4]KHN70312.1 hypothetical protein M896_021510 [Ordospora colligata OC4]TBU16964.1 hypothetical protein CWI40_021520 [Ordospora colligata]